MKTIAQCRQLATRLVSLRGPRETRWRELRKYVYPWRGIFEGRQEDSPTTRQMLRFTQTASQAVRRGASGITSGMTPRNASWFKPDFIDPAMTEASGARVWLDQIDKLMKDCLASGGFYQAIQAFNTDLIWAGCALLYTEAAPDNPLRYECLQPGVWCVALDSGGALETVLRHAMLTRADLERVFPESPLPGKLADKNPLRPYRVWHLVTREDGAKPYASYWWLDRDQDAFLRVNGYYEMPFFFTCWNEGATPYGTGPGDEALPDARQLDILERRKLAGIAKIIDPPVRAPQSLKGHLRLDGGSINYTNEQALITPLIDLGPISQALPHIREEIRLAGSRLEQSLIASIFTSVSLEQRPPGMSATEFLERKREALQQLGPVMSAYEPNVLTPMLFRTIQTMDRNGALPPPPKDLAGCDLLLKMEFTSPMATALRQSSAEITRAIFQDVAQMVQQTGDRQVLDKLDLDQIVDELASGLGAPGSVVRADSDVAAIRSQRQQAEAAQRQLEAQMQAAQAMQMQAGAEASLANADRAQAELGQAASGWFAS